MEDKKDIKYRKGRLQGVWNTQKQGSSGETETIPRKSIKLPCSGAHAFNFVPQPLPKELKYASVIKPSLEVEKKNKRGPSGLYKRPKSFCYLLDRMVCAMAFPSGEDNFKFLHSIGLAALLNLTEEREYSRDDLVIKQIKIKNFTAPTMEQIDEALSFILKYIEEGKVVGFHCMEGIGRTSIIGACFLMRYHKLAPEEAVSTLRSLRSCTTKSPILLETVKAYYDHNNSRLQATDSKVK